MPQWRINKDLKIKIKIKKEHGPWNAFDFKLLERI